MSGCDVYMVASAPELRSYIESLDSSLIVSETLPNIMVRSAAEGLKMKSILPAEVYPGYSQIEWACGVGIPLI